MINQLIDETFWSELSVHLDELFKDKDAISFNISSIGLPTFQSVLSQIIEKKHFINSNENNKEFKKLEIEAFICERLTRMKFWMQKGIWEVITLPNDLRNAEAMIFQNDINYFNNQIKTIKNLEVIFQILLISDQLDFPFSLEECEHNLSCLKNRLKEIL